MLHRRVARLFILHAVVHSLTLLVAYKGSRIYASNFPQTYFSWLLAEEVRGGYKSIGVVVCGPGELGDEVRAIVARLERHEKTTICQLEVDQFSW